MKIIKLLVALLVINGYSICQAKNASQVTFTNVQYYNSDKISYAANPSLASTRPLELHLEQKIKGNQNTFHGAFDAEAVLSSGNPDRYVNLRELYFASTKQASLQVAFGRKKELWSYADEFWQTGLWQPRFRVDYLRPEQQGLIGGFAKWREQNIQLSVLASPLYNPDISPQMHIDNGRLYANTPWFHPPVQSVDYEGVENNVNYEQRIPDVDQIILRPSAAISATMFFENGWLMQTSYAYKPMNQVLIGFEQAKRTDILRTISVTATPRILHHHVGAVELVKEGDVFGHLSLSGDQVIQDDTPSNWTKQEVDNSKMASVLLGSNFGESLSIPLKAYIGYYKVWGGDKLDSGLLASNITLFETRFTYTDALSLGMESKIPGFSSRLSTTQKLLYDFDQLGMWYSGEVVFQPEEDWRVSFGADILGIVTEGESKNPRAFLRRYRANDNVRGGVTYVF